MVAGLKRFVEHFRSFTDSFVLIGGSACDLWMGEFRLRFRATDDLDVVLIMDAVASRLELLRVAPVLWDMENRAFLPASTTMVVLGQISRR